MTLDFTYRLTHGVRSHPDVVRPRTAIALAVVGAAAALFAVARFSATSRGSRAARPPEPASLVWEG